MTSPIHSTTVTGPTWPLRSAFVDHRLPGVRSGIAVIDVTMRVLVWLGLLTCVVALLIGAPAAGVAAGALWLNTAGRTFAPALRGRRRRTGARL